MRKRAVEDLISTGGAAAEDPRFVTAAARGLEVLRAFRKGDRALGNQDLAERTGLAKATVSRLTYTLSILGYLDYLPESGKYRPGAGALSLGYSYLSSLGLRELARPIMQELADRSGLSVALGTRDRISMVYLECCRGDSMVTLALDVGSHIKLGTSAMGRAYIAGLPEAERAALLADLETHEGTDWPRVRDGLKRAQSDLRDHGFCVSLNDWKPEINACGVPLSGDGMGHYALNCGAPAYLLSEQQIFTEIGPRLAETAARIHQATGRG